MMKAVIILVIAITINGNIAEEHKTSLHEQRKSAVEAGNIAHSYQERESTRIGHGNKPKPFMRRYRQRSLNSAQESYPSKRASSRRFEKYRAIKRSMTRPFLGYWGGKREATNEFDDYLARRGDSPSNSLWMGGYWGGKRQAITRVNSPWIRKKDAASDVTYKRPWIKARRDGRRRNALWYRQLVRRSEDATSIANKYGISLGMYHRYLNDFYSKKKSVPLFFKSNDQWEE